MPLGSVPMNAAVHAVVTLRALLGERAEMAALQQVFESSAAYLNRVTGLPPGPADAQSTYSILPEGKDYDDKFVFGVFVGARMVGCVDLIRAYPDRGTAHIGLLLIAEEFQRQGVGAEAYRQIEREIRGWRTCLRIRVGVVGTNHDVLPFWRRLGFVETGERKPYRYANVLSETIVLEKQIA
jgi:RimJ/RimL family protein N-acetyltransferase